MFRKDDLVVPINDVWAKTINDSRVPNSQLLKGHKYTVRSHMTGFLDYIGDLSIYIKGGSGRFLWYDSKDFMLFEEYKFKQKLENIINE